MNRYVVLLTALQALYCSGFPLMNGELASMAGKGLGVALAELNTMYAVGHLYRVTRASVSRAIPVGLNTFDLLLTFGVRETVCLKASREDPQGCAFKSGFFVTSGSCSARVHVSAQAGQVVSLRCGQGSSSSSESSEETFAGMRQPFKIHTFVNSEVLNEPPPSVEPRTSFHGREVQTRGDTFNNFLE